MYYSRITSLGLEGHCTIAVSRERFVYHVDVHKGRGPTHVDAYRLGAKNLISL